MSKPSFSNIDLWLFELSEGNLTPSQVEQLKAFLLMHPELDVDKDVWEAAHLEKSEYIYTKKESLKRDFPIFWFLDFASVAVVITGIVIFGFFNSEIITNNNTQTAQNKVETKSQTKKKYLEGNSKNATNTASIKNVKSTIPVTKVLNAFNNSSLQLSNNSQTKQIITYTTSSIQYSLDNDLSVQNIENSEDQISEQSILDEKLGAVNSLETSDKYVEFNHSHYDLAKNYNDEVSFLPEKKSTVKRFASSYNLTLKSKLGVFGRKVRNMMDNPIALKNFRDPHYNIPGLSVSDVNFSSAGNQLASRVQTLSRLQWFGKENQQLINQLNVDGYVYGIRGGLGLQINHSTYRNGGVSIADAAITYSPKISLSNTVSFEPSVRFKMGNKSLKHSKMDGINQVEVERGVVEDYYSDGSTPIGRDLWYKDLGVGLMVNTKWFFAGVQMDNLFRHKDNMYSNTEQIRANYHFTASLGTDWVSSKGTLRLSPYAVYQNEGRLNELWVGANMGIKWFVLGASYSTNQDPSATIGVKFKHFSMYYNADYSKSIMTGERSLSHQLTLKVVGKQSRFGRGR